MLLPFSALLAPAREAFARAGGWLPRIETPRTLAASLAPPPVAESDGPSGDRVLDLLHAAALLRQQPGGAARERADRRGHAQRVAAVVEAALALRESALQRPPHARAAYWEQARRHCPAPSGPGALEATLLRLAVEWAAGEVPAATDVLFSLRPGAWVVVRVGGADVLADAVAAASAAARVPALHVDLDRVVAAPAVPVRRVCEDREHEALAAASLALQALQEGRAPVALVALDRELMRRVRALLDRRGVPVQDETGWALSTTPPAAALMARLRAASPAAGADARLDWLKQWPPARRSPRALEALEALWREARVRDADRAPAEALWALAQERLAPWHEPRERPLADWLSLLAADLARDAPGGRTDDDPAQRQLAAALRLDAEDGAWQALAASHVLDLAGFTAWVDATLEAARFEPPPAADAQVVLTPLARAIGRPFAAVIVAGADPVRLGVVEPAPSLVGEPMAQALGLEGRAERRERQRLALLHLLRVPSVAFLRRHRDGDEPLGPSPEVQALALRSAARGQPWPEERPWRPVVQAVARAAVRRPAPTAGAELPERLSATALQSLRDCPYRFFARSVLRLAEADELEAGLAKRDYGNWLHGVLHRFHRERQPGQDDAAALAASAEAETQAQQLDGAELLPYRASFEAFVPAYLRWLADRDAQGWRWEDGETEREARPAALHPQWLQGRLDRLDRGPGGLLQIIDYKTGRADELKRKVRDRLEDTQLAFYAALAGEPCSALYLALDDAGAPLAIEHEQVDRTAQVLVQEIGAEFARLRAGAPLPPLGEGPTCELCEARGLCRRDHWDDA